VQSGLATGSGASRPTEGGSFLSNHLVKSAIRVSDRLRGKSILLMVCALAVVAYVALSRGGNRLLGIVTNVLLGFIVRVRSDGLCLEVYDTALRGYRWPSLLTD